MQCLIQDPSQTCALICRVSDIIVGLEQFPSGEKSCTLFKMYRLHFNVLNNSALLYGLAKQNNLAFYNGSKLPASVWKGAFIVHLY